MARASRLLMVALPLGMALPAWAVTGFHLNADGTPLIREGQVVTCPNEAGAGKYLKSWPSTGEKRIRGTCGASGNYQESWVAWHDNGEKDWKAEFVDGVVEGRFRSWHANGEKRAVLDFVSGTPHGEYDAWHVNGVKAAAVRYVDGEPNGCWESWYDDAQDKAKGAYNMGKKVGKWFYWDADGNRRKEVYGGEVVDGCLIMI